MLDLNNESEIKIVDEMKKFVSKDHGISFALAMRQEDGTIELVKRISQPCYGELRKYLKSHGEEYTDPKPHDDYRPSDLHHPFPKGIPEAVAIPNFGQKLRLEHKEFLGPDSPYPMGDISSVIFEENGFIILDTEIDPTVMVNLFNTLKSVPRDGLTSYESLRDLGLSVREAFAFVTNFVGVYGYDANYNIDKTKIKVTRAHVGYYFSPSADFYRIENALPNDLTGGTFRNRYDYNRKRLHDVFSVEGGEKIDHNEFLQKTANFKTVEEIVEKFKEYYKDCVYRQTPEGKNEAGIAA